MSALQLLTALAVAVVLAAPTMAKGGSWRVARALDTLLGQINAAAPRRSKASDGSIGDAAHASRDSDHNPWVKIGVLGIVTARDFTHDPRHGFNAHAFADRLRIACQERRERRVKYIISNGRIASSKANWAWRRYPGPNPHDKHCHVSVYATRRLFDSTKAWLAVTGSKPKPTAPTKPAVDTISARIVRGRALAQVGGRRVAFHDDVRDVQALLNTRPRQALRKLPLDGIWGERTTRAYRGFEKAQRYQQPDGVPDAQGVGLRALVRSARSSRRVAA